MRRLIDGKIYDNQKARKVASVNHDDRGNRGSTLQQTGKGNWFVYDWSHWQGEGCSITPVSAEHAINFLKDGHFLDELKEEFPEEYEKLEEA